MNQKPFIVNLKNLIELGKVKFPVMVTNNAQGKPTLYWSWENEIYLSKYYTKILKLLGKPQKGQIKTIHLYAEVIEK